MAYEIEVGPTQIALHQGYSVLVAAPDGQISSGSQAGLYFFDTRMISSWRIFANGEQWQLLNGSRISHYASRIFLINPRIVTQDGEIAPHTIALVLSRSISGGVHEDFDIVNYGNRSVRFNLEISVRSDFADLFEVKSGHMVRRGRIVSQWSCERSTLTTVYRNRDFYRKLTMVVRQNASPAVYANGRISFAVDLGPGAAWHSCVLYHLSNGQVRLQAPEQCIAESRHSAAGERLTEWREAVAKIRASNQPFYHYFCQAIDDMAALRLPIEGRDHRQIMPAAGVPWFVALFGRDSLIASLQNALVYPGFACGTLDTLGSFQAKEDDAYRDAEPGKIMHELRRGELAHFNLIPHTPYYGSADATPLYLIVLHVAWRCTGDDSLLHRHLKTAEGCLRWIDDYGDQDGDGFQEYATRSPRGYENQGWKDAGDAVMYPDGTPVKGPKALCELQGYVYDAWQRMAEVFERLGKPERAQVLRHKASKLFRRFNEEFWDDAAGFYAYALDGDKKKVATIVSNPGHCLWSGIVPAERARRVVARLLESDMWSGWGIRTLSARHPSYNPHSYQNGSVWPHDNGIIALGFRRYGFTEEAARVAGGVTEAASFFALHQVPELYAGIEQKPYNFPVQYLGANVPQAWAAGSVFAFLQAMLGFQPDAPNNRLYLDPHLPAWLPDLTIFDLQVGEKRFDLRFERDGERTRWEMLKGDRDAVRFRSYASGCRLAAEDTTAST